MTIAPKRAAYGLRLAALLAFLPAAATARGASPSFSQLPLKGLVRKVERSYNGVRALRAHFVQTYISGGSRRTESGTVLFARGGRMRWDYLQPQPKLFLSDGKQVLLYLPSEGQLDRSSVKKSEDYRVPFRLLLTRLHLHKYFSKIEDGGKALPHPAEDRVLLGIPKGGARAGYRQVLMEFDPRLNLRRLVITYTDGSRMDFHFDHIKRNPPIPPGTFKFHAPAGTEIVQE